MPTSDEYDLTLVSDAVTIRVPRLRTYDGLYMLSPNETLALLRSRTTERLSLYALVATEGSTKSEKKNSGPRWQRQLSSRDPSTRTRKTRKNARG